MITVHSEDYIVGLFSDMRVGVFTAFWVMAVCSLVLGYQLLRRDLLPPTSWHMEEVVPTERCYATA